MTMGVVSVHADTLGGVSEAMRVLIALLFGLSLGSFLTVVVHRVPEKQSVVAPRSACPACGTTIAARDNIPVVSYLMLRGKCRSCGARISPVYPLIELLTAALVVGAAVRFDRPLRAAILGLFLVLLVAVAVIDARHRIIPNRLVYPAFIGFGALVAVGWLAGQGVDAGRAAIGMAAFGGGLLLVALISPRGMGMGDVKLAGLIGLVLGSLGLSYVAVAAFGAILAGGVGAIVALVAGGARRGRTIPFGPYLAVGAVVAIFAAPQLSQAYLRLLP
jgi:leader peptidase (prepilin peptidase)/N-methyltransferase